MYNKLTQLVKFKRIAFWLLIGFTISCSKKSDIEPSLAVAKDLIYNPALLELKTGTAGTSVKPSINAIGPLTYTLSTNPANNGAISINNEGIITASSNLAAGDYQVSVSVANATGSVNFPNVYRIKVIDNPVLISALSYTPSSLSMEAGESKVSVLPAYSGTLATGFSISVSPITNAISIDNTGKLSFGSTLTAGTYQISVTASNPAGSIKFDNAYTLTVSASSGPKNLTYTPNAVTVTNGTAVSSAVPTITSTSPVSYALTSSPSAAAISINSQGVISASSALAVGTYKISVKATNIDGNKTFTDIFTITVNPASTATTFNGSVKAIMQNNCGGCHNWGNYTDAKSKIDEILRRVNLSQGASGMMPQGGTRLSQALIDEIQKWKNDGLKEN